VLESIFLTADFDGKLKHDSNFDGFLTQLVSNFTVETAHMFQIESKYAQVLLKCLTSYQNEKFSSKLTLETLKLVQFHILCFICIILMSNFF